ncbi:hypothetical protein NIES2134_118170 [Thermostichus vulcanus NIES-2134]|nr:hypothetical protein NIES2134_118170 [Thermostichus vulcanus NIES-2134]
MNGLEEWLKALTPPRVSNIRLPCGRCENLADCTNHCDTVACGERPALPVAHSPPLTELATLSEAEWERRLPTSALRRIKPAMERRNAQGNLNAQANIKQ